MDTMGHCIEALRNSMSLTEQAIQIEIAVSFVVFNEKGGTTLDVKKILREIYASAGRVDCLTSDSPSYKTVNRRMGRCADFYDILGHKEITKVLKGKKGKDSILAIVEFLKPHNISNMDDLAAKANKGRKTHESVPGEVHVRSDHIKLDISADTTVAELSDLIKRIKAIIKEKESEHVEA